MRLRYLFIILSVFVTLAGSSYGKIDPQSVVGIWLFDEGSGDIAQDSSGNGHDGQINGDLEWVAEGKFGKALAFPGVDNSCVEVPHDDSLDLTTFSFTLWAKIVDTGGYQAVFIKTADGMVENYSGYIYDTRKVFWCRFTSGGSAQWGFQQFGTTIVTDDEWHHLAGTYDMKSVKSYIDGVAEADAPFSNEPDSSPGPLSIGDCPGYPYPVNGLMDDVGLFNVALTEDEIQSIMNNGLRMTATAVSVSGKLATAWGSVKGELNRGGY